MPLAARTTFALCAAGALGLLAGAGSARARGSGLLSYSVLLERAGKPRRFVYISAGFVGTPMALLGCEKRKRSSRCGKWRRVVLSRKLGKRLFDLWTEAERKRACTRSSKQRRAMRAWRRAWFDHAFEHHQARFPSDGPLPKGKCFMFARLARIILDIYDGKRRP